MLELGELIEVEGVDRPGAPVIATRFHRDYQVEQTLVAGLEEQGNLADHYGAGRC